MTGTGESWAPADCTLPTAERAARAAEFSVPPARVEILDALAGEARA